MRVINYNKLSFLKFFLIKFGFLLHLVLYIIIFIKILIFFFDDLPPLKMLALYFLLIRLCLYFPYPLYVCMCVCDFIWKYGVFVPKPWVPNSDFVLLFLYSRKFHF